MGTATTPAAIVDNDFQKILTDFIETKYGRFSIKNSLCFVYETEGVDGLETEIKRWCDNVYMSHSYEYQKLSDSMGYDYDPIANYDMTEIENIVNSGDDITTDSIGKIASTTERNKDATSDNEMLGDTSVTDSWGAVKTSGNNADSRAPFNSQVYQNLDKNTSETTRQAVTDSHTAQAVENIYDKGAEHEVTKVSTDEKTDKETLTHGHIVDRELTRKGNIGVTTSQQMIQSERDLVRFNLVRIVASDIVQSLCSMYIGVNV